MRALILVVFGEVITYGAGGDAPLLLLQKPSLSKTQIVFVYAGDLWTVPRQGGEARRLTSGPGIETNPVFSPDGNTIAFTGEYDGNVDIYSVPTIGGIPKRLTWHPAADNMLAWSPDGTQILFSSSRESYGNYPQLYTTDANGRFPNKLPLPWGWEAAWSPDGSQLAYVPMRRLSTVWKHYRGGGTTPIWLTTLTDSKVEEVPRKNSNDYNPLWIGNKVWFLSDRNGPVSLFSYDTVSRKVNQEIRNDGLDFKSIGAGPDAIIVEQFGGLSLFDIRTSTFKPVSIQIAGDLPEVRDHLVNVSSRLTNAHLSPTGARAVFEARGEVITLPAEKGEARNITNTPNVMERYPAWAPDGKTIAYFSDESGEYAIHLAPQTSTAISSGVTKIDLPEPGTYRALAWSPDSKKLSFIDSHMRIWFVEIATRKAVQVDKERFWNPSDDWTPVWSPDSKWLVYSKRLPNYLGAIYVWSLETGKPTQITDGMSDAKYPVFDKDGRYLYFTASTDAGPSLEPDVAGGGRTATRSVYLAVLRKGEPSPFVPESDEETVADSPKSASSDIPRQGSTGRSKTTVPEVRIDLEDVAQRIIAVPLPPRRYVALAAGKGGTVFALESQATANGQQAGLVVHRLDLKTRKSDVVANAVQFFEVSFSGEKMLTRHDTSWNIRGVPAVPASGFAPTTPASAGGIGQLNTASIEVKISPRAEWKQMYHEAWRIERDYVFDYHGLDLTAAERRYEPFVDAVASRADLNYLFAEMLGNLVSSHLVAGGGEQPSVRRVQTGLLGCDFAIQNGLYRISHIYNGENWNPDARAPLTEPGVNVVVGEYLFAVNGRDLKASDDVYSLFENTANSLCLNGPIFGWPTNRMASC